MRRSSLIPAVAAVALFGAGVPAVAVPSGAQHAAPAPVSRLRAYDAHPGVTLDWADPSSARFDHVVVRYRRGAVAPRHRHGRFRGHHVRVGGRAESATLHGLASNTAYSVTIWAVGKQGNRSASRHVHFTTDADHVGRGHYVARYTDAAGHPLAGVVTSVEPFGESGATPTAVSGRNGRISLDLPAGKYLVYAGGADATGGDSDATGYQPSFRFTTIHAGQAPAARKVMLAAGGAVRVHVVDSRGRPVAGVTPDLASVSNYVQTDTDFGSSFSDDTEGPGRTDANGDAIVKGVAPFSAVQVCVDPYPDADAQFLSVCSPSTVLPRAGVTARATTLTVTRRSTGRTIAGQLRDRAGRGFAQSGIEVFRGKRLSGYATTTRGGRFRVTGLRPGTYRVCADGGAFSYVGRTGYVSGCRKRTVKLGKNTSVAGASVVLGVGAAATGTVTGPHGAPVPGEYLSFGRGDSSIEAVTDSHGHFVAKGLTPGRTSACVEDFESTTTKALPYGVRGNCGDDPFRRKAQRTFAVQRGRIRTGLDLHLPAGAAATGTVVDGRGRPVPYAEIDFERRTGHDVFGDVTSADKHGHFVIAGQQTGTYRVCATPIFGLANQQGGDRIFDTFTSGGGCSHGTKIELRTGHLVHHVRLVVPTTSAVRVTTRDQDGRPVAGVDATVIGTCHRFCEQGTTLFPKQYTSVRASATTNSHGTVLLDGLKPGHYAVCLFAFYGATRAGAPSTGYADRCSAGTYDIDVRAGHTVQKKLVLRPAGAVSGRIADANGTPLAGVLVHVAASAADDIPSDSLEFADPSDEGGPSALPGYFSTTAADGTYTVRSVVPGKRLVCADPAGVAGDSSGYLAQCVGGTPGSTDQGDPVSVNAGATTGGVDLSLGAGGAITGTITTHVPHGETDVVLFQGSKAVADSPARAGRYRFSALAAGTYTVCADSYGRREERGRCYDDVAWNVRTANGPPAAATPVDTRAGSTTTGIDIVVPG